MFREQDTLCPAPWGTRTVMVQVKNTFIITNESLHAYTSMNNMFWRCVTTVQYPEHMLGNKIHVPCSGWCAQMWLTSIFHIHEKKWVEAAVLDFARLHINKIKASRNLSSSFSGLFYWQSPLARLQGFIYLYCLRNPRTNISNNFSGYKNTFL